MKQIFEWLREQCKDRSESCYKSYLKLKSDEDYGCSFAYAHAVDLINEAEAKWEADCCSWKKIYNFPIDSQYTPSCDYTRSITITRGFDFVYCPYCGKKIKRAEVE